MLIVIIRHGQAESYSGDGTDFSRALKPSGERQAAYLADRLAEIEPAVTRIVSSRAARAWKTASIIGETLGVSVEAEDCLLVDEPASAVIDRIAEWAGSGTLVMVGHNPQVSRLAALLGGSANIGSMGMRTGEAVVIEIDPADPIGGSFVDQWRCSETP